MNVLVTGGTGFVGSHITEALAARGDSVTVVDNYATSRKDTLQPTPENVRIEVVDITDRESLSSMFDACQPDAVVHCAASYDDPDNWTRDSEVNVTGSINVVKEAERVGTDRFVYFQTALCYGTIPNEQPVTLDHPIQPDVSYAISKTAAEQYIDLSELSSISFRLANFYGPRNLSGPIPVFYERLSNGKECFVTNSRRDFIYVEDIIPLVKKAVDGTGDGHYNVSTGEDCSIKHLYETVAAEMNSDLPVEERERAENEAETILLDPSRVQNDFDWEATTSLQEGVEKTIDWYDEYGVEQTYTHLDHDEEE